jgi:hypothetical protein
MRELTEAETEEVAGGFIPVVAFGLAVTGKLAGSTGVTGWAIGSASLVLASYSMADYFIGA